MDQPNQDFVIRVIEGAHDLTLATIRPDGYPQATTVSFAHDGLTLFVGIGKHSQKANNVRQNNKVSLTINLPYHDWREIRGLSMSALAEILDDPQAVAAAQDCLLRRFPQVAEWGGPNMAGDISFLRITPRVISVLDYSKGFGHTELVTP
jgi:nitroimidazol reductase NimA-like FMN-containing flavoprotein (pyridoxamine 5'-phosphate oxidase superfamily)